jgi:hypothetical protein
VSWRAGRLCIACQRRIHGPGTGVVGPQPERFPVGSERPTCWLCYGIASPGNVMRFWSDDGDEGEPLDPEPYWR